MVPMSGDGVITAASMNINIVAPLQDSIRCLVDIIQNKQDREE